MLRAGGNVGQHKIRTGKYAKRTEMMLADPGGMHSKFIRQDGFCQNILNELVRTPRVVQVMIIAEREIAKVHRVELKHRLLPAVLLVLLPYSALGEDRVPLLGTWRLDFAPQYSRVTCRIEAWEKDGLRVVYDMVGRRGGVTHWEWMGKLDGRDYPLEGVDEFITNAYSQLGERTYSIVLKVDGRVSADSRITVSPDGKTMSVTTGPNTAIYRK